MGEVERGMLGAVNRLRSKAGDRLTTEKGYQSDTADWERLALLR